MKTDSLRLRLLGIAALSVTAALIAAWVVMTLLFERHTERRVVGDLTRQGLRIVAALEYGEQGRPILSREPADPLFNQPASGLYWQVTSPGGAIRSRSLWDEALPTDRSARLDGWRAREMPGPFGQRLVVVARRIASTGTVGANGTATLVQVGFDMRGIDHARRALGTELAAFLVFLWLALGAAAWVQVTLGLRPLKRIQQGIVALRRNPAERLTAAYPSEVRPLIDAINDLAAAREADLLRARQRAADLAHGMKTPLAALAAQSRLIAGQQARGDTEGLDRAIAAATAAVEAELSRSRAAASRHAAKQRDSFARRAALGVAGVLERTERGAQIDIDVDIAEGVRVPIADDDLTELLGTLMENAVRHARHAVRVTVRQDDPGVAILIEDDGPGMSAEQAERALERGVRLDERGIGHGLGLAIARDLVEANDGTLSLSRSALGGLCAAVAWA